MVLADQIQGSVGEKAPGTDLKLSNGDEGEILTKSPIMFSKHVCPSYYMSSAHGHRYLFDSEATRNSLDEEGYFKTGDIARREGKYYFIMGRASIDSECTRTKGCLNLTLSQKF